MVKWYNIVDHNLNLKSISEMDIVRVSMHRMLGFVITLFRLKTRMERNSLLERKIVTLHGVMVAHVTVVVSCYPLE